MNGTVWIVEVKTGPLAPWSPWYVRETRHEVRTLARDIRPNAYATRVRKYLRQPETRP